MHSVFKLEVIKDTVEWDSWINEINTKIFFNSFFYKCFGKPFEMVRLYKGNEIVAGWILAYEQKKILRPPFVPYNGLFYCFSPDIKNYRLNTTIQEINAYFCKYLIERFEEISLRFSPEIQDVQQFIWSEFTISLRYTYVLPISLIDKAKEEQSVTLRRNIKKNYNRYSLELSTHLSTYLNLIKATRTDVKKFLNYTTNIEKYLCQYKIGICVLQRNQQEAIVSASFIVWDNTTAYYLAGGYNESLDDEHASEVALWKAIEYCSSLGIKEFDFEGSMIPGVEEFFRKFGGKKKLYFHVVKKKQSRVQKYLLNARKLLRL